MSTLTWVTYRGDKKETVQGRSFVVISQETCPQERLCKEPCRFQNWLHCRSHFPSATGYDWLANQLMHTCMYTVEHGGALRNQLEDLSHKIASGLSRGVSRSAHRSRGMLCPIALIFPLNHGLLQSF